VRLQDQIVKQTQRALDDVLRAVEAIPVDKQGWKPAETARSSLELMEEMANFPVFLLPIVEKGFVPDFGDHGEFKKTFDSYEASRSAAVEGNTRLCNAISSFPDSRMEEEVTLPFVGGLVMTMADVLGLQLWNLTYHHGQLNYIQTILGDLEMH
jgi:hypothetical protein